ncbi:hypothetical protein AN640_00790 [Candidatus Epulonipiscium fishelsonii]|uniref:Uncharacterized protein n=1 Tax=Candidatus Epulonipiscium fishelsonii TaxID=77094 RepID=A0ACC8XJG9_9FIRM|nr:hypothetical protein AN640_00790 [Epulopiscium sp. SCG-D08WGA-EpuloA1]
MNEPIFNYISTWNLPNSEFNADGITAKTLLSHTSGMVHFPTTGIPMTTELQTVKEALTAPLDVAHGAHQVQEAGESIIYSNAGYGLLELAIEETTGLSYNKYMKENILEPLGMNDSTFSIEGLNDLGKVYNENGTEEELLKYSIKASAGLISTPNDIATWLLNTLNPNSILNEETIDTMLTEVEITNSDLITKLTGGFGLSYSIEPIYFRDEVMYTHTGNNPPGWKHILAFDTASKSAIAILTNSQNGDSLYAELIDLYTKYIYDGTSFTAMFNVNLFRYLPYWGAMIVLCGVALIFLKIKKPKESK